MVRRSSIPTRHHRSSSVPRNAQLKSSWEDMKRGGSKKTKAHLYDSYKESRQPSPPRRPLSPAPRQVRFSRSVERRLLVQEDETRQPIDEEETWFSSNHARSKNEETIEQPYETYSQFLEGLSRERKQKVPIPDAVFLPERPKERRSVTNSRNHSDASKRTKAEMIRGCTGARPSRYSSSHSRDDEDSSLIRSCTGARPTRGRQGSRRSHGDSLSSTQTPPPEKRRSHPHRRMRQLNCIARPPNKRDMLQYQQERMREDIDRALYPTRERHRATSRPTSPMAPLRQFPNDTAVAERLRRNNATPTVAVAPGADCMGVTKPRRMPDQQHDAKWFAFVHDYLERNVLTESAERFLFGPKLPPQTHLTVEERVSRSWESSTYEQESTLPYTEDDTYGRDTTTRTERLRVIGRYK